MKQGQKKNRESPLPLPPSAHPKKVSEAGEGEGEATMSQAGRWSEGEGESKYDTLFREGERRLLLLFRGNGGAFSLFPFFPV